MEGITWCHRHFSFPTLSLFPAYVGFCCESWPGYEDFKAGEVMRTATAAQRLKPQDEKRKQALIQIPFDVNAPGLRPHFHGSSVL